MKIGDLVEVVEHCSLGRQFLIVGITPGLTFPTWFECRRNPNYPPSEPFPEHALRVVMTREEMLLETIETA